MPEENPKSKKERLQTLLNDLISEFLKLEEAKANEENAYNKIISDYKESIKDLKEAIDKLQD